MTILNQLEKKPGVSLVLSGGATKAFYFHLGVLKALKLEHVSSIVGSSAGAVVGGFLASGATVDNLITALYQDRVYVPRFDKWIESLKADMLFRPRYRNIMRQALFTSYSSLRFVASLPLLNKRHLLTEAFDTVVNSQSQIAGFFSASALQDLFESLLPSMDFRDLDLDLYVTATDIDRNRRTIFNHRYCMEDEDDHFIDDVSIARAVRASASVPGLFDPVKIKGRYYVDGEVKRTLSADIGMHLADTVIVSHTYQPLDLPEGASVNDMGWWNVVKQSAYIIFYERIKVWERLYRDLYPDKEIIFIVPDPDDVAFFKAPQFSFREDVQLQLMQSGEAAARQAVTHLTHRHEEREGFGML